MNPPPDPGSTRVWPRSSGVASPVGTLDWVPGLGFQGLGFQGLGFKDLLLVPWVGFRVPGLGFQGSGLSCWYLGLAPRRPQRGKGFKVLGLRISGLVVLGLWGCRISRFMVLGFGV